MRLRIRGPKGVGAITLSPNATWSDLKQEISKQTDVSDFDVKYGYPPQTLDTTCIDDNLKLSDFPFNLNGEQLIIAPRDVQPAPPGPAPEVQAGHDITQAESGQDITPSSKQPADRFIDQPLGLVRKPRVLTDKDPPEIPVPQLDGTLVLRVMPDDNSCMFRALSTAVLGSSLDGMTELRSIVAQTIYDNRTVYDEAVLEKKPEEYCKWIQREDSWGGGIELSILSQHFDIEICSINVQDTSVLRFNEGRPTRCVLVYSGIHYDVCAVTPFVGADPEFDRKVFEVVRIADDEVDGGALEAAVKLCKILQAQHYYTDTNNFDIKCNTCGEVGKGETWATQHAGRTGHTDFGEK